MVVVVVLAVLAVMASGTEHHHNNNTTTTTTATTQNSPTRTQQDTPDKVPGAVVTVPVKGGTDKIEGRFFGASSTSTITDVAIVTSTVFFSCLTQAQPNIVCGGRRRRKRKLTVDLVRGVEGSSDLDTSLMEQQSAIDTDVMKATQQQHDNKDDDAAKNSKLFVTIWTVSRTTSTVTMLFTDTNTTLRLTYACRAGQQILPMNCFN
ncbi:hypothetical protein Pcinc_043784 [Petrolisthes cinctipes]|uniref:Uncharacterized protein n=1 Tax=Petrolisthes cinctipes TaxID=88211 RepID=A0AAE1BFC8_PETCI|nr:hypothetical protein Pcinc_043784 [Petrolisthes cinctipes]